MNKTPDVEKLLKSARPSLAPIPEKDAAQVKAESIAPCMCEVQDRIVDGQHVLYHQIACPSRLRLEIAEALREARRSGRAAERERAASLLEFMPELSGWGLVNALNETVEVKFAKT